MFCQNKTNEVYIVGQDTLNYTRIDYSQYGTAQIYITMYEETESTKDLVPTASLYLRGIPRLYHTLYFFIPLEKAYSNEYKEKLFAAFAKFIVAKENLRNINLYLNFDQDYSETYLKLQSQSKDLPPVKKIETKIRTKKIHKVL